jgi:hypothetical protein
VRSREEGRLYILWAGGNYMYSLKNNICTVY